jgi:hypothetical protein
MIQNQAVPRPNATQVKPRILVTITGALLIACMQQPTAAIGSTFPDQPEQKPAQQVGSMTHSETVAAPPTSLSREEIEDEIQALEAERIDLLGKYASAHPDVRSVERRLQVRRKQWDMRGPAPTPAPTAAH